MSLCSIACSIASRQGIGQNQLRFGEWSLDACKVIGWRRQLGVRPRLRSAASNGYGVLHATFGRRVLLRSCIAPSRICRSRLMCREYTTPAVCWRPNVGRTFPSRAPALPSKSCNKTTPSYFSLHTTAVASARIPASPKAMWLTACWMATETTLHPTCP